MENNGIRAFIALELSEDVKENIAALSSKLSKLDVSLVAKEKMHITMFFFESISSQRLNLVKNVIEEIDTPAFELSVKGTSAFTERVPRVIFADIGEGKENVMELYESMKPKIEDLGIYVEQRDFTPHITIGRARRPDREKDEILAFVSEHSDYDIGSYTCRRIKLMRSDLTSDGPVYTEIYAKELSEKA